MDLKKSKKIIKLLLDKSYKISFAESCTGGLLSNSFTSINGCSKVFSMGLITYSNQSKVTILKVPKNIIKKYGAVSKECCLSMVSNLSRISKSEITVSTTGIAGPSGGSNLKPVGLVYIGIKNGNKVKVHKFFFKNHGRLEFQKKTVKKTLNLILKNIK